MADRVRDTKAPAEARARAQAFCDRFGLRMPVLQAPMAGSSPPELAIAVAGAGGMGGAGVLRDDPACIAEWVERFRAGSGGAFQLNIWTPEPPVHDVGERERRVRLAREFLARFGKPGQATGPAPDYAAQCRAMLAARPTAISSIMGLFDDDYVRRLHDLDIAWFACATTLEEALAAQDAGADAVVAQGMEAGGHRGAFDQDDAVGIDVGLFALLPWFADHLRVPVIAAGGIGDGRGVAAAISAEWSAHLGGLAPEATVTTRAYTGRLARAAPTSYLNAWTQRGAPPPAPFPDQLRLVGQWREGMANGLDRDNHWAGQSAALAIPIPAGDVVARMWQEASDLLA
jgi:nitronate monooxygenase